MSFFRRALFLGVLALSFSSEHAQSAATQTTANLNLRAGPGMNHRVLRTIPAGSNVNILSCGTKWCYLSWAGHRGFSNGRYLRSHITIAVSPLNSLR
jgi:uncharacterized protein YraI